MPLNIQDIIRSIATLQGGFNPEAAPDVPIPDAARRPAMLTQEVPERTGMFGLKGTPRDLLGVLGDAFLVQAGRDPMYRPARQQEQIGDAFKDFTKDPDTGLAKIGAIDPTLAGKLYDSREKSEDRKYRSQLTADYNNFRVEKDLFSRGAGMMGAANAQTYGPMLERLKKRASAIGRPDLFDDLPDQYDANAVNAWSRGGMTRYQQETDVYRDRMVNLGQGRLDEGIRSNRAREGLTADRNNIYRDSVANGTTNAERPRETDSYTGEDGYRYTTWDDGTTTKSAVKEKPKGTRRGRGGESSPTPASTGIPKVGEVRKGYRFKGGNPADKNSWEKVN